MAIAKAKHAWIVSALVSSFSSLFGFNFGVPLEAHFKTDKDFEIGKREEMKFYFPSLNGAITLRVEFTMDPASGVEFHSIKAKFKQSRVVNKYWGAILKKHAGLELLQLGTTIDNDGVEESYSTLRFELDETAVRNLSQTSWGYNVPTLDQIQMISQYTPLSGDHEITI